MLVVTALFIVGCGNHGQQSNTRTTPLAPISAKPDNPEIVVAAKSAVAGNRVEATRHYRGAYASNPDKINYKYDLASSLLEESKPESTLEAKKLLQEVIDSGKEPYAKAAKLRLRDYKSP